VDLYQLLAHTIAAGLPSGLLVYAAREEEPFEHEASLAGKKLVVTALDLAGEPREVDERMTRLSERVRHMGRSTARRCNDRV
jgi:hypothetical protein